jgi:hypothetical protein
MDIALDTEAPLTPAELRHAFAVLDLARRRRELLFWTIAMTLTVIVLVAMTVAFVVSLIQGSAIDPAQMTVGAGITGASASVRILGLLRR